MLGKMLIFTFSFLGVFALLMGSIPGDFITAAYVYNPSYRDVTIQEEFEMNNMVVYDQTGGDNMTFPYDSLNDGPSPPDWEAGLPTDQYMQVWWGTTTVGMISLQSIRLVHKQKNWWGYTDIDTLTMFYTTGEEIGYNVVKATLEASWNEDTNSSALTGKCNTITTNILFKRHDEGQTIGENWDDGHLDYLLNYDANFTDMSIGAFQIVGSLLAFQAPNLGIGGTWGSFLNLFIAIPCWAMIAYICYKIIAGLIPFMSGGSGD